jgi:hypothetical protein
MSESKSMALRTTRGPKRRVLPRLMWPAIFPGLRHPRGICYL